MTNKPIAPVMLGLAAAAVFFGGAPAFAQAQQEDVNDYARARTFEVGGALTGDWSPSEFTLGMRPSIGYFIADGFELSLLGALDYENLRAADGTRTDDLTFAVLLEPSYHLPVSSSVAVFGGLGVGVAFVADHPLFDVAPRVGLNIEVGRSGVFTPQISVPIFVGRRSDPTEPTTTASLSFGAGFTTTF